MARVNSLLCYKGRTGATVTMTIASPCVLTLTAHGVNNETPVVFTTTGALPTGVTAGVTYYTRYVTVNTFHLYDTLAHALDTASTTGRVNTSGTQSGTHTIWSSYWHNLSSGDRTRYGTAGSERVFAQMKDFVAGRSSALSVDDEYLEIVDSFSDLVTVYGETQITYAKIPSYRMFIETKVNGVLTPAYHGGNVSRGYDLNATGTLTSVLDILRGYSYVDGFRISHYNAGNYMAYYDTGNLYASRVSNMILRATGGRALVSSGPNNDFCNILIHSSLYGLYLTSDSIPKTRLYNCTIVKCTNGVYFTGTYKWVIGTMNNVVSYGNTANWPTDTLLTIGQGYTGKNAGVAGDKPIGLNPLLTVTSADFVDFANNDFRISENSALRDSGYNIPMGYAIDILEKTRPNYSAGQETADNWDIGAFEYDSGNGEPPVSANLLFTGVQIGTEIHIYRTSDNVELAGTEGTTGTTFSWDYTWSGNVEFYAVFIKRGYEYLKISGQNLLSTGVLIPVIQKVDRNYSNPT